MRSAKGFGETNTEKVRFVQEDLPKALVAESLTRKACFSACVSIINQ